jgi:DNA-binding CsgD family transcriptional regulator
LGAELLESLVAITTSIFEAADRPSLFQTLHFGTSALGFDVFALSCGKPRGHELISDPTLTTAPSTFLNDYDQLNWFEGDTVTARLLAGEGPFFWDSKHAANWKDGYVDFLHSARMQAGLMIPLPHRHDAASAMGLVSFNRRSFGQDTARAATIMANAAMAKAEMLGLCPQVSVDEAIGMRLLSHLQMEILKWIAEGKSNLVIAAIMGLNVRAVRYHVAEILRKLGVATRIQAAGILASSTIDSRRHGA